MSDDLKETLDRLCDVLALGPKVPRMWSGEQIATWLGLSLYTVTQRVVCRPGFPRPITPTGEPSGQKRWFADEVIEWCRDNRDSLPVPRKRAA